MTQLKEGDKAPGIENILESGKLKGKKLILYFYPKDNTPGCTAEACNLRDNYETLKTKKYEVIGVSPDNEVLHEKFKTKNELPFQLIADTEKKILNDFGVWGEKKLYGKTYMGVNRTTFIINDKGIIEKIITKVQTKDHANQILNDMQ
ncbi:MAG: thioredoxin-dependent thiol peroxidase [Bacteroidales bacterium]|nr:thioredoxin-dependent thiol peroxidase [Bacteroidales bacterium]MBN2757843.1 thioredoxin-dependent thiol peroxidase [Bacteroidales bacterium]